MSHLHLPHFCNMHWRRPQIKLAFLPDFDVKFTNWMNLQCGQLRRLGKFHRDGTWEFIDAKLTAHESTEQKSGVTHERHKTTQGSRLGRVRTYRKVRLLRLPNDAGMLPVSLLLDRSRKVRAAKFPSSGGILPLKLLLYRVLHPECSPSED